MLGELMAIGVGDNSNGISTISMKWRCPRNDDTHIIEKIMKPYNLNNVSSHSHSS